MGGLKLKVNNAYNSLKIPSKIINKAENNNSTFSNYLKSALDEVNSLQINADNYKKMLATGEVNNLHEVMIASEKADVALQFTLNVRNKIMDAYKEIMRMQI